MLNSSKQRAEDSLTMLRARQAPLAVRYASFARLVINFFNLQLLCRTARGGLQNHAVLLYENYGSRIGIFDGYLQKLCSRLQTKDKFPGPAFSKDLKVFLKLQIIIIP